MDEQLPLALTHGAPLEREPFIAHAGVAEAFALIEAWPAWPSRVVALVGPEGSGKSHLAALWAERAGAERVPPDALPAPEPRPVLLEDADRAPADEALFHLINRAGQPGGGLLLTARRPPATWETEVPDLRSRLNAVQVVEVAPPDEAGFAQLIRAQFHRRGITTTEDLITFLARRVERSALAARKVAEQLDAAGLASGRPVTRALAREVLGAQPTLFDEG